VVGAAWTAATLLAVPVLTLALMQQAMASETTWPAS
jgi:hypothetical protein